MLVVFPLNNILQFKPSCIKKKGFFFVVLFHIVAFSTEIKYYSLEETVYLVCIFLIRFTDIITDNVHSLNALIYFTNTARVLRSSLNPLSIILIPSLIFFISFFPFFCLVFFFFFSSAIYTRFYI